MPIHSKRQLNYLQHLSISDLYKQYLQIIIFQFSSHNLGTLNKQKHNNNQNIIEFTNVIIYCHLSE